MRIALISDIHGNCIALDAALADIKRETVDQIICLGDVIFNGPQPRQALERVRELGCPVVMGNTDEFLLDPPTPDPNDERDRVLGDIIQWGIGQMSTGDLGFIRSFRPSIEIQLDAANALLAFHGSMRSNWEMILSTTPDAELADMLGEHRTAVMAGGHTHTPMLRRYLDTLVINPGSVGMPIQKRQAPLKDIRPPRAEYAIITLGPQWSVDFRRTPFDLELLLRTAQNSGMPHYEWWAAPWLDS